MEKIKKNVFLVISRKQWAVEFVCMKKSHGISEIPNARFLNDQFCK